MEVVFLSGVADKVTLACRLLRKKYREGARVAVYGPSRWLARVDQSLWSEPALDFVPHLMLKAGAPLPSDAARTYIWLLEAPQAQLNCDSAINLGFEDATLLAEHHAVVAELVSQDPEDRAAGQRRWKQYKAGGHQLKHLPQDGA